ncbi:MAG: hypothetical protein ACYTHK_03745 [Planctomycetota bacterium]|jgi:hypothetical protein
MLGAIEFRKWPRGVTAARAQYEGAATSSATHDADIPLCLRDCSPDEGKLVTIAEIDIIQKEDYASCCCRGEQLIQRLRSGYRGLGFNLGATRVLCTTSVDGLELPVELLHNADAGDTPRRRCERDVTRDVQLVLSLPHECCDATSRASRDRQANSRAIKSNHAFNALQFAPPRDHRQMRNSRKRCHGAPVCCANGGQLR